MEDESEKRRTRMLMIRLSADEGRVLDAAAKSIGLPTGTWMRSLALQEAKKMEARSKKNSD